MKLKRTCCNKFRKKAKACERCPIVAPLDKGERKALLAKARKRLKKRKKRKKAA